MMIEIIHGDCRDVLATLPANSVHCVVTSPPYWGLRDYGVAGQIGLEPTPQLYADHMVEVFRAVRRVLRPDGTLWLNMGDSYCHDRLSSPMKGDYSGDDGLYQRRADYIGGEMPKRIGNGLKLKDLCGIPWRVAFALQADGWWLRQDIVWSKPNPMPESVTDRCTKAHEYVFLLSKSARYFYDAEAIRELSVDPGIRKGNGSSKDFSDGKHRTKPRGDVIVGVLRNKRSVWEVATQPFAEAHFATFPPALIEPCILAGCPKSGIVLDPFGGAGTVGLVADRLQRNAVLIELNPDYVAMARRRVVDDAPLMASVKDGVYAKHES